MDTGRRMQKADKTGRKERILAELKRNGFRITSQRKLLIDIILSDECSCCKEIYYQAVRQDPSIGIATVYRMVKTLEDIGAISRKNMYRISCDADCGFREGCILVLENQERVSLTMEDFREAIGEVLRRKGYPGQEKVETVLWNPAIMAEAQ